MNYLNYHCHITNVLENRHTSVVEVLLVQTFSNSYDIKILFLRGFPGAELRPSKTSAKILSNSMIQALYKLDLRGPMYGTNV